MWGSIKFRQHFQPEGNAKTQPWSVRVPLVDKKDIENFFFMDEKDDRIGKAEPNDGSLEAAQSNIEKWRGSSFMMNKDDAGNQLSHLPVPP